MDDETRAAFAENKAAFAETRAAFAETRAEFAEMRAETRSEFAEMRAETRSEFAEMRAETRSEFAKIDYWFEKNEAAHGRTRGELAEIRTHLAAHDEQFVVLRQEISALKQEFHRFRDWASAQFIELRTAVRDLSARFEAMG